MKHEVPIETKVWIDMEVESAIKMQRVTDDSALHRLRLTTVKKLMECAYLRGKRDAHKGALALSREKP